jgi:putative PEP-CTERM system histidine kinase
LEGIALAEALSYLTCAAGYLLLTVLLIWRWRRGWLAALLVLACILTVGWALANAVAYQLGGPWGRVAMAAELLRDAGWFALLLALLRQWRGAGADTGWRGIVAIAAPLAVGLLAAIAVDFAAMPTGPLDGQGAAGLQLTSITPFFTRLLIAIVGLMLVENLYRNAPSDQRWSIKFLVLALAGLFTYDLFLYSSAALLTFRDPDWDAARGLINVLVVPLIAVSAARSRSWGLRIHVSRQIAFYSASLLFGGAYLLVMSAAGYYVRIVGGSWGGVLQLSFLFVAAALLVVVLVSGRFRAQAKGFLGRHFYSYKYDYREEWLRFIRTLAVDDGDALQDQPREQVQGQARGQTEGAPLGQRVIRAVADILDSPDGLLWLRRGDVLEPAASWNRPIVDRAEPASGAFAQWLEQTRQIVDLKSGAGAPVPAWLGELRRAWLVLPLLHRNQLAGFMVLGEARAPRRLDQEDHDLLLTAGRQAASYLAESVSLSELLQAREFESFNRRTTFLVHDLKNLLGQLSLLTSNAQRHRANPEFIDDMVATVESSVAKMRQLLVQLRPGTAGESGAGIRAIDAAAVLQQLVRSPTLARVAVDGAGDGAAVFVKVDPERFAAVLRNLLENAVEAAGAAGKVTARVESRDHHAVIEVRDTGPGMDPAFIRDELFSPFRTTKGEGYGIGAFESREFARQAGGRLEVESAPGQGTAMRLVLPAAVESIDTKVDLKHERA